LVEVNQKIPDRDEAELRLAVQVGEPSAASRVFDGTPASRAPLTLLPAREATGVAWHCKKRMKKDETTLDSADDVIHGNWIAALMLAALLGNGNGFSARQL
jgi:hypothetical protein